MAENFEETVSVDDVAKKMVGNFVSLTYSLAQEGAKEIPSEFSAKVDYETEYDEGKSTHRVVCKYSLFSGDAFKIVSDFGCVKDADKFMKDNQGVKNLAFKLKALGYTSTSYFGRDMRVVAEPSGMSGPTIRKPRRA